MLNGGRSGARAISPAVQRNQYCTGRSTLLQTLKRLVHEEDGMEMVEWAIVGVVFAVAAAVIWASLSDDINAAIGKIENEINP